MVNEAEEILREGKRYFTLSPLLEELGFKGGPVYDLLGNRYHVMTWVTEKGVSSFAGRGPHSYGNRTPQKFLAERMREYVQGFLTESPEIKILLDATQQLEPTRTFDTQVGKIHVYRNKLIPASRPVQSYTPRNVGSKHSVPLPTRRGPSLGQ